MSRPLRGPFTEPESEDEAYDRWRQEMDDDADWMKEARVIAVDELEIYRLSAEALEIPHEICGIGDDAYVWDQRTSVMWEPTTNAEQRWECHVWLLHRGTLSQTATWLGFAEDGIYTVNILASPEEQDARAVAELRRRQK